MPQQHNRRQFLSTTLAATALMHAQSAFAQSDDKAKKNSVCVFTKPFQSLTYDELADHIAELGFDGIEAPIRKGGHIEPDAVPDELPRMVEALAKRNLKITVLTSSINDPNDPLTESVLKTACGLGIRHYRMAYFKYADNQSISDQLNQWKAVCHDLAAMNREIGISAVYQNHAGRNYFGAALWDLQRVLSDIDPEHIGVAYDIRHATVEGGMNWPVTFRMIRPHVTVVYVKDFHWVGREVENVPLGKGHIDPKFFRMLADSQFDGPISLHEEYLDHRKPELVPQHLDAIRKDYATLKSWLS